MNSIPTWAVIVTSGTAGATLGAVAKGIADWLTETRRFRREDRQRSEAARRASYAAFSHSAGTAAEMLGRLRSAATPVDEVEAQRSTAEYDQLEREVFHIYSELRYLAPLPVVEAAREVGEALTTGSAGAAYEKLRRFNDLGRQDLGLLGPPEPPRSRLPHHGTSMSTQTDTLS